MPGLACVGPWLRHAHGDPRIWIQSISDLVENFMIIHATYIEFSAIRLVTALSLSFCLTAFVAWMISIGSGKFQFKRLLLLFLMMFLVTFVSMSGPRPRG